MTPEKDDWEAVLRAAAELQKLVPGSVLVGGTAAAIHAAHRRSHDADHVLPDLGQRFAELLELLEGHAEWTTHRVLPGKLVLGDFMGVETGLRQLIRSRPLETTETVTKAGPVTVPTPAEMVRIKAWLVVQRNATRDYIDLVALTAMLGQQATAAALRDFDDCYRDVYRPEAQRDVSPLLQLGRQLADPRPRDLADTDVSTYKGIAKPWAEWATIAGRAHALAVLVAETIADA